MEMERVEASIAGWSQATYQDKADTDANYKRMLQYGLTEENVAAVRLGVASHNLFDVSYALVLAHEQGLLDAVQFEMLEGMANHQRRALCELTTNVLLYAPATRKEEFVNAIGYLIRRLDENTGPENFLRHAFKLEVDTDEWIELEQGFVDSFGRIEGLPDGPRRRQDRLEALPDEAGPAVSSEQFVNEADTDFSLSQNLSWAEAIIDRWRVRHGEQAVDIPLVIAGDTITEDRTLRECLDPSRPDHVVGR
jgi:RHH-type proline utilization regulon transcriptional repressor/proline dehydrogenase/delta 1-pyrroline-5-carboxylate dehydrogenase